MQARGHSGAGSAERAARRRHTREERTRDMTVSRLLSCPKRDGVKLAWPYTKHVFVYNHAVLLDLTLCIHLVLNYI